MKKAFLCILSIFLLTACQAEKGIIPTTIVEPVVIPDIGECLPPITNFSYYPPGGEKPGPTPVKQLPSGGWEVITSIPNLPTPEFFGENTATLEILQTVEGQDRIWIVFGDSQKSHISYYQIANDEWKTIEVDIEYADSVAHPRIFLGKNGLVWMTPNLSAKKFMSDTTVLSIFDETYQQFVDVLVLKDFFALSPGKYSSITLRNFQVDSQGDVWFFGKPNQDWEYQLFQFSPSRKTLQRHLDDLKLDGINGLSLVVTPENLLYMLGAKNGDFLIRFDPANKEIDEIEIPSDVASSGDGKIWSRTTLFLDNQQRLWINDKGWLDLSLGGDWHIVIRSPIFIDYMHYGSGTWGQTQPEYSLESPDGRLWYSSHRGTGWVDPSTGKWCLFTSYASNVVRDSNGYLWIIAAGNLYRSLFKP